MLVSIILRSSVMENPRVHTYTKVLVKLGYIRVTYSINWRAKKLVKVICTLTS